MFKYSDYTLDYKGRRDEKKNFPKLQSTPTTTNRSSNPVHGIKFYDSSPLPPANANKNIKRKSLCPGEQWTLGGLCNPYFCLHPVTIRHFHGQLMYHFTHTNTDPTPVRREWPNITTSERIDDYYLFVWKIRINLSRLVHCIYTVTSPSRFKNKKVGGVFQTEWK